MPVHDWTRVRPATFHDFHGSWITHLKEALNGGLLPQGYYALAEQPADEAWPDVLALEAPRNEPLSSGSLEATAGSGIAVAETPPQVEFTVTAEAELTAMKQRTLVIRHATGDRIVALLEIVSPGNKSHKHSCERFVDKAVSSLRQDYHLLIIDLFPPGPHDAKGIHGAIWNQVDAFGAEQYQPRFDKPLTLVAYQAKLAPTAYLQPVAVGDVLPKMPLFYRLGWYVDVPLEETYQRAWSGVPQRWRSVIEAV